IPRNFESSAMPHRPSAALLILLLASACASAAPLPPAARAEVDALLARLAASSCQFNRNGSWHDAQEAKTHLLRKLDYLEGKDLVKTAEQFIELGAAKSSTSGKPYLVRCGSAAAVESKAWLLAELKALRSK